MPQNTPERSYPYPCYSDLTDFPAQMEAFADAVDLDVQTLEDDIAAGLDRVALRISRSTDLSVANNTNTAVTWVDTAAIPGIYPGAGSVITLPRTAIYLLWAQAQWANNDTGVRRCEIHRLTPSDATLGQDVRNGATLVVGSAVFVRNTICTMVGASAGTTLEVRVFQNSGGALTSFNMLFGFAELSQ